jgi:acyl dehydratase
MPDATDPLTDAVRAWIGRATEPMELPEAIAPGDVRRYVEATGETNPLWLDDDVARKAGFRGRVVPPMMVAGLTWRLGERGRMHLQIPLPAEFSDVRNAGHEIEWFDAVYIGDRLTLQQRITAIEARSGKRGIGVYVTRETEFRRAGDERVLAIVRQTTLRRPRADGVN